MSVATNYMVYLDECGYDIGHVIDPISYNQAISNPFFDIWLEAVEDEMRSVAHNNVWELVEPPKALSPLISSRCSRPRKL